MRDVGGRMVITAFVINSFVGQVLFRVLVICIFKQVFL